MLPGRLEHLHVLQTSPRHFEESATKHIWTRKWPSKLAQTFLSAGEMGGKFGPQNSWGKFTLGKWVANLGKFAGDFWKGNIFGPQNWPNLGQFWGDPGLESFVWSPYGIWGRVNFCVLRIWETLVFCSMKLDIRIATYATVLLITPQVKSCRENIFQAIWDQFWSILKYFLAAKVLKYWNYT